MKFVCPDHGEQEQVQHDGYSLAHNPPVQAHERDLEGIMFTFDVVTNGGEGNLELELADADGARDYLSKFADWEEQVTEAAESEYEHGCPECGNGKVMFWLGEDEEIPA